MIVVSARVLPRLEPLRCRDEPGAAKKEAQVHSMTVDTRIVSIREPLDHLLATVRAIASFQKLLWPVMVIAVAAVSSLLWTIALLWLVGNAIW